MENDLNQTGAPTLATPPAVSYPEDYEELKGYRDKYTQLSETLSPYIDDIRPIIEDEGAREFFRTAYRTYENSRKPVEPEIPAELKPVVDRFESQLGPLVEFVNETKRERAERLAAEEADKKAAADAAQAANLAYAQKLAAERPDLAEDDYAGIGMLAAYAAQRNLSLEEAWNRKGSSLSAPPKREKPPTSLRGDAAAPGVPGESKAVPITSRKGLTARLADNLRAAGMKG